MSANYVPRVVVWFREIYDGGTLGNFISRTVALTSLGQLRIGSVWKNGRSSTHIQYPRRLFRVNFREDHWNQAQSSAMHWRETGDELISQEEYQLRFGARDRSKLLSLSCNQETLIIPCLEFLRCYGRNQEINRVLTTYAWDEVAQRLRLNEPIIPKDEVRVVELPWFATEADCHLLSHLRYDAFAQRMVRGIRAEIENELGSPRSNNHFAFPTIGPWFTGPAEIEVEGVEVSPGTFLGLRISGYTVPLKPSIQVERKEFPPVGNEGYSGIPHPARHSKHFGEDEIAAIDDDLTPDQDSELVVISDTSIRLLAAAPVTRLTTEKTIARGSSGPATQAAELSAPGVAGGSGKGVGLAHFVSEVEPEKNGALTDLWKGLKHLHIEYPNILTTLNLFTFEGTVSPSATQELKLLSLGFSEHIKGKKKVLSSRAAKWVYTHLKKPTKPRGALVIEVGSPLVHGYLFEVQRRIICSKNSDDGEKEQSYCGLAIETPAGKYPGDWIPEVLFQIAEANGIMGQALAKLSGLQGQTYRRSRSAYAEVSGQATAILALSKLNIDIPKSAREDVPPNWSKKQKW